MGLIFVIALGLFFRSYQIVERFEYAHDGDLYSFIIKDIAVDGHFRLIGQLTSAPGVFVGPLFYYLLLPFVLLTKMDPIGAVIPITIMGILTVFSYFVVFERLFRKEVGLIASFLQATLLSQVWFDRAVVPSTPTNLWIVWYFFVVINLTRGNFSVLPILGILIGLIWHIHIALLPPLIVIPFAIFLSQKIPAKKYIILFLITLFITSLPLLVFEIKHGFSQTISFVQNFTVDQGGGKGADKLNLLTIKLARNISRLYFYPHAPKFPTEDPYVAMMVLVLVSGIFLVKKKLLSKAELKVFYIWVVGVALFYTFSSVVLSEYYITNLEIIFLVVPAFWFYYLYKNFKWGKWIVLFILAAILIKNLTFFLTQDLPQKGYVSRKLVAQFIAEDANKRGFPCVAVSYLTKPGEDVGFRYFFYLNNLHVNQVKSGSPIYTVVIPLELASDSLDRRFGQMGVIVPKEISSQEKIKESCSGQNSNLTDPLFGFTK